MYIPLFCHLLARLLYVYHRITISRHQPPASISSPCIEQQHLMNVTYIWVSIFRMKICCFFCCCCCCCPRRVSIDPQYNTAKLKWGELIFSSEEIEREYICVEKTLNNNIYVCVYVFVDFLDYIFENLFGKRSESNITEKLRMLIITA